MTLGGRVPFEGAWFDVNYGDRVALTGPNVSGIRQV
jgi:ATPase subunit of ABC transporter with duplicated ATPase domains